MSQYDAIYEKFDEINRLLNDSYPLGDKPILSETKGVLLILRTKALSHAQIAYSILKNTTVQADAIVLLRCAYEADIVALYLEQHEEKVPEYLAHSEIVHYKNYLRALQIIGKTDDTSDKEARRELQQLKNYIIRKKYLEILNLQEKNLNDLVFLESKFSNAQFVQFHEMRRKCSFTGDAKCLQQSFQFYNIGSQITHSNFSVCKKMYTSGEATDSELFPLPIIYTAIAMFIIYNYKQLVSLGTLDPRHQRRLLILCKECQQESRKWIIP